MKVANRTDAEVVTSSFNGSAFSVEHMTEFSVVIDATETVATLGGDFQLQASNNAFGGSGLDHDTENASAIWVDISGACATISGSDQVLFDVTSMGYSAVRVKWTRTGGSGTANVYWNAKGHI